jgi:hypothetical protein
MNSGQETIPLSLQIVSRPEFFLSHRVLFVINKSIKQVADLFCIFFNKQLHKLCVCVLLYLQGRDWGLNENDMLLLLVNYMWNVTDDARREKI